MRDWNHNGKKDGFDAFWENEISTADNIPKKPTSSRNDSKKRTDKNEKMSECIINIIVIAFWSVVFFILFSILFDQQKMKA